MFVVVQSASRVSTPCDPMVCSTSDLPVPHHLPEFAQIHVHCVIDAVQPSHPLMPSSPSAFNLSQHQGLFPMSLHQVAKVLAKDSASASVLPVSIRVDFFNIGWSHLLAVQGTPKNLLQHHSLKVSFLQCSAFFMVQLSQQYMTTGKTIALTVQTFVSKLMSLLFNTLSFS